jgi:ribosomal protein S4
MKNIKVQKKEYWDCGQTGPRHYHLTKEEAQECYTLHDKEWLEVMKTKGLVSKTNTKHRMDRARQAVLDNVDLAVFLSAYSQGGKEDLVMRQFFPFLSTRLRNCMLNAGLTETPIKEIAQMDRNAFLRTRNFGAVCYAELTMLFQVLELS